jgi:Uma2 family endonuclease
MMDDKEIKRKGNSYPDRVKEDKVTYEDYASLDDGNRYELANGVLELMSPGPSVPHQIISAEILKRMAGTCDADYLILSALVDLILSAVEVRQPDLMMIHRSRLGIVSHRGVEGPPDLVVEILSPSTLRRDKLDKSRSYAQYGIPEYWIVDPGLGALERYELNGEAYLLSEIFTAEMTVQSNHIPCVSFTMGDILSRVPDLSN